MILRDDLLAFLRQAKAAAWTSLDLAGLELEVLPPDIGELTQLEVLILGRWDEAAADVIGNRLTSLPATITQLHNLTELSLWQNQLSD